MRTTPESSPSSPERPTRRRVLVVAGATVAFALAVGLVAAVARPSSYGGENRVARTSASEAPSASVAPSPAKESRSEPTRQPNAATDEPSDEPSPDPYALADGTYPAFITNVDVDAATVTVDLIQLFEGTAARRAAIEDGVAREDARYLFEYIRNENDLLRTLPVAADVRIEYIGVCDSPPTLSAALAQLRRKTTPYDETYYYQVGLVGGAIDRLTQHLAISAC